MLVWGYLNAADCQLLSAAAASGLIAVRRRGLEVEQDLNERKWRCTADVDERGSSAALLAWERGTAAAAGKLSMPAEHHVAWLRAPAELGSHSSCPPTTNWSDHKVSPTPRTAGRRHLVHPQRHPGDCGRQPAHLHGLGQGQLLIRSVGQLECACTPLPTTALDET